MIKSARALQRTLWNNAFFWHLSRETLDVLCGLYKRRIEAIEQLNIFGGDPSVLDLGCGVGMFAGITKGYYLGIDFNQRYINYAGKRRYTAKKHFQCFDLRGAWDTDRSFDIILIADLFHHLNKEECVGLLKKCSGLDAKYLICYDLILSGRERFIDKLVIKFDPGRNFMHRDSVDRMLQECRYEVIKREDVRAGLLRDDLIVCRLIKNT
jgi:SAM-dependent methyltransferase